MRAYLQKAPWWVFSILTGVIFGGLTTVFGLLEYPDRSPVVAVISGAVQGVFFGAIMGPFAARQRRPFRLRPETCRRVTPRSQRAPRRADPCRWTTTSAMRPHVLQSTS
jgi:hypothetical protein